MITTTFLHIFFFPGLDCETDIDECAHAQCENGATCQDGVAEFTCQCIPGYTGSNMFLVLLCDSRLHIK